MKKARGKTLDFEALKKSRWEAVFSLDLPTQPGRELLCAAFEELVRGLDHLPFPRSPEEAEASCGFVRQAAARLVKVLRALGRAPEEV